jgi:HD superfamily phosphodiesterase
MNRELQQYIEQQIIPQYDHFDKAHQRDHVEMVIKQSMELAQTQEVDLEMVYTIAAYHDVGLCEGRERHHLVSAKMLLADPELSKWFSQSQLQTMAEAVEDHRASSDHEPRSLYGRIVAEADRFIDPDTIIRRTVQYGMEHYPELNKQEHYERMLQHLHEKYGRNGYLHLWFANSPNAERLETLRQMMEDEATIREKFEKHYTTAQNNRTIRAAQQDDMTEIMKVVAAAKQIMRQSGNVHQWVDGYPSEAVIAADMEKNGGFVVEDNGKIVGYFAYLPSPEPTYHKIYDGKWLDDTLPYHVVHRIASYPEVHGVFSSIMDYCFSHDRNIRIDTHRDNNIMRHNILKHGFHYCGIIYLTSGDERLAYQKTI